MLYHVCHCRDEAVMLPSESSVARNRQSGALAGVIFEKKTAPELGEVIQALNTPTADALFASSPFDVATIRDATREYSLEINKTKELVTKAAELEGRGYTEWVTARKENDWDSFQVVLQEIVQVKKEIAAATQPSLSNYDANIDQFERGMSSARIQEIFSYLKESLDPLINDIANSPAKKEYKVPEALKGSEAWDIEQQKAMCLEIAEVSQLHCIFLSYYSNVFSSMACCYTIHKQYNM
jgi:carboxypeptidase Taq